MATTRFPLMPGPWLSLSESESHAFLERLTIVLMRATGQPAFTQHLPISGLRVTPLSFYPGWLLAEGEAQLTPEEFGTFNVLYGPGFMWVMDGEAHTIHELNSGRIPDLPAMDANGIAEASIISPSFLPSPLIELDLDVTGPDYLRFFCGAVWGEAGPFWLVESMDAPILQGAQPPDDAARAHIKPISMRPAGDHLLAEAVVCYTGALFQATFKIEDGGILMEDDKELGSVVMPEHRYHSPFRNLQSGTMETPVTTEVR